MRAWLLLAVLLPLASPVFAEKPERVPIYVRSAANADGFTDPSKARQDSLKDILERVRDSKVVRQAESEADGVATIEVLSRDTRRQASIMALGAMSNKSYVTVRLTAGEFSTEFSGNSGSKGAITGYGAAAKQVVRQIEDWVKANRERLAASR